MGSNYRAKSGFCSWRTIVGRQSSSEGLLKTAIKNYDKLKIALTVREISDYKVKFLSKKQLSGWVYKNIHLI